MAVMQENFYYRTFGNHYRTGVAFSGVPMSRCPVGSLEGSWSGKGFQTKASVQHSLAAEANLCLGLGPQYISAALLEECIG